MEIEIEWNCPNCRQITNIVVEVESPSDYYFDSYCEHCNHQIKDGKLDMKVMEEAAECHVRLIDFRD